VERSRSRPGRLARDDQSSESVRGAYTSARWLRCSWRGASTSRETWCCAHSAPEVGYGPIVTLRAQTPMCLPAGVQLVSTRRGPFEFPYWPQIDRSKYGAWFLRRRSISCWNRARPPSRKYPLLNRSASRKNVWADPLRWINDDRVEFELVAETITANTPPSVADARMNGSSVTTI
jgi:hypothetical protein